MKHRLHIFVFLTLAVLLPTMSWSQDGTSDRPLPKVHIIATGGTIAGTSNDIGYDAGKVSIETILQAVPELTRYAELDYEQFCNIGSQDMSESIWLPLAKRVNQVLESGKYDAVLITHGTDTMEETAFFLNLTTHNPKPVILVGAMRPSDVADADGPANLLKAVQTIVKPDAVGKEVMCCLGGKVYEAGAAFKNDTHSLEPLAETSMDWYLPHNTNTGFFIDNLEELPEVGIVYGYGSNSTVALEAYVNAGYKGIVFAGVGDGNLNQAALNLAAQAAENGVMIVRSSRVPYGGVYTEGGEVDDEKLGFIASGSLSPQKSRILLMLALTATRDIGVIRSYFRQGAFTYAVEFPGVSNARQLGGYIIGDKKVRRDLLLRSGNLSKASSEAVATLHDKYKLALVTDFRSSMERGKAPDRDVEGATNVWLPVLEKMISNEGAASVMASLHLNRDNPSHTVELLHRKDIQDALSATYDAIVFDDDCHQSYAAFLDSLVALPEGRAALWHCSHGKDRCGWGTAFVLAALGADRSLIVDDFSKSNISYAQEIEELVAVARSEGSEDELTEYIHLLRGVSVAFFEKTLDAIDARYGSIDNFLEQELGLTADEKRILRDKFLENR